MTDDEIVQLVNDILLLNDIQQAEIKNIISSYMNQQLLSKPVAVQELNS